MQNISLVKLEMLCSEIDLLISEELVDQSIYEEMIEVIKKVENTVKQNKNNFKDDFGKIITICKYMIFNLMLKITECFENDFVKPIYQ